MDLQRRVVRQQAFKEFYRCLGRCVFWLYKKSQGLHMLTTILLQYLTASCYTCFVQPEVRLHVLPKPCHHPHFLTKFNTVTSRNEF